MSDAPRYDGIADWYEGEFRSSRSEDLQLEWFEESEERDYPYIVSLRCRR